MNLPNNEFPPGNPEEQHTKA